MARRLGYQSVTLRDGSFHWLLKNNKYFIRSPLFELIKKNKFPHYAYEYSHYCEFGYEFASGFSRNEFVQALQYLYSLTIKTLKSQVPAKTAELVNVITIYQLTDDTRLIEWIHDNLNTEDSNLKFFTETLLQATMEPAKLRPTIRSIFSRGMTLKKALDIICRFPTMEKKLD